MFRELSKMEQRYDAVLGAITDGYTVTEVARKLGASRQSIRAWLARYEGGSRSWEKGRDARIARRPRSKASPKHAS